VLYHYGHVRLEDATSASLRRPQASAPTKSELTTSPRKKGLSEKSSLMYNSAPEMIPVS
jgi:hypothetical protein